MRSGRGLGFAPTSSGRGDIIDEFLFLVDEILDAHGVASGVLAKAAPEQRLGVALELHARLDRRLQGEDLPDAQVGDVAEDKMPLFDQAPDGDFGRPISVSICFVQPGSRTAMSADGLRPR